MKKRGFETYTQTTGRVEVNQNKLSKLPHKTVATRGGLGWIGKNCLLVTPQYGSAIRISSLLTNAPLKYDEPVNQSYCGTCNQCVKNCPAQALKQIYAENVLRFVHIPKDICKIELYNFFTFYMKILFQITNVIKKNPHDF